MITTRALQETDSAGQISALFSQLTGCQSSTVDVKKLYLSQTRCILVLDEDKIIGFGSLVPYYLPTVGEVGKIEDIIIDKKYRGQGLGELLMMEIIKLAEKIKLNKLQLTSNPKREAARSLYQKLGFMMRDTNVFVKEL